MFLCCQDISCIYVLKIMSMKILCHLFLENLPNITRNQDHSSCKLILLMQTLHQFLLSTIWCHKTKLDFKSNSSSKFEMISHVLVQFPSTGRSRYLQNSKNVWEHKPHSPRLYSFSVQLPPPSKYNVYQIYIIFLYRLKDIE